MSQLMITSYGPELERQLHEGASTMHAARRGKAKPSRIHKGLKPLDKYRHVLAVQLLMFAFFWTAYMLNALRNAWGSFMQTAVISFWFCFTSWRQRYATSAYKGDRVKEREFSTSQPVSGPACARSCASADTCAQFKISDIKLCQRAFSGSRPGGWLDRIGGKRARALGGHITLNDLLVTVRILCKCCTAVLLTLAAGHLRCHPRGDGADEAG
jgi:hypothetical protein